MGLLIVSLLFAFVLGFSAHRTGICAVSAVAEVITSKTALTFLSFFKVTLWVALVACVAVAFAPELTRPYQPPGVSLSILAGGLIFGVGAGINGGCSFSTISKIAQGDLHVALTLPAFVAGALSGTSLHTVPFLVLDELNYAVTFTEVPLAIVMVLAIWAGYELLRMLRLMFRSGPLSALVSPRYRLSTGAALIGVSSGFLYLIHGRWAYSSRLMDYFGGIDATVSVTASVYLFVALLAGAVASAASNRQLKWSFAGDKWPRNLLGGFVMGFGAMMIPGGNGKLILYDLPHLSVHAILAYLAMTLGIACVLLVQRRIYGAIDIVSCAGDECRIVKPD